MDGNTLKTMSHNPLFFSPTGIDWLQACTRGASHYILDRIVKVGNANGMTFGAHIHSGLALRYRMSEFNTTADEINSAVIALFEKQFYQSPTDEDDWRTLNWAVEIFQHYQEVFANDDFKILHWQSPQTCKVCAKQRATPLPTDQPCSWCNNTGSHTLMAEVSFAVKLFDYKETPIYLRGIIDLPIRYGSNVYIMDFKTTAVMGQSFWDDKDLSMQQKAYCWAFEQLTGLPVKGHITRGIRVSSPPKYLLENRANPRGETKQVKTYWQESLTDQRVDLRPGEIDEWKQDAITLIEEFLWHKERGYYPKRTLHCSNKFGRCSYWDVCHVFPAKDRISIFNSQLFTTKTSPFV